MSVSEIEMVPVETARPRKTRAPKVEPVEVWPKYFAKKPLTVNDKRYEVGDHVPEANGWLRVEAWERTGWLRVEKEPT